MQLQLIYAWSKKLHKWTMWLAILLGVPLAISGVIMEGDSGWRDIFTASQMLWIRSVHRAISTKFAVVLAVMMITGFLMWLLPKILRSQAQSKLS